MIIVLSWLKELWVGEIRKPRGFDKEVRILRWDKLVPALQRALQSYYTEIPINDPYAQLYRTEAPETRNN